MIGAYTSAVYSLNTQFATNIAIDAGMVKKKMNERMKVNTIYPLNTQFIMALSWSLTLRFLQVVRALSHELSASLVYLI